MPKKSKKAEVKKNYSLYVLLDWTENTFFIGNTTEKRLSSEYWDHYSEKVGATKEFVAALLNNNRDPKMYFLTTVEDTKQNANGYMIPYIKYFLEKGMQCINSTIMISKTNELTQENQELYEYLLQYELMELCNDSTDLFPDYSEQKKKKKNISPSTVTINVTKEDYKLLENRAKKHNMSVTKYCKQTVLYDSKLVQIDFSNLNEQLSTLTEIQKSLQQIMYTIYKTGNYYPEDLTLLQTMIDEVKEIKKDTLQSVKRETKKLNSMLK